MEQLNHGPLFNEINSLFSNYDKELEQVKKNIISLLENFKQKYDSDLKLFIKNINNKLDTIDKLNQKEINKEIKAINEKSKIIFLDKINYIKDKIIQNNDEFFEDIQNKIADYIEEGTKEETKENTISLKSLNDDKAEIDSSISEFDIYNPFNKQNFDFDQILLQSNISRVESNQNSGIININNNKDKKIPPPKCKEHPDKTAVYQCVGHCDETFCKQCFNDGDIIYLHDDKIKEINKKINKDSTKNNPIKNFLNWNKRIIEIYVQKFSDLINSNRIPEICSDENVDISKFENHITFLNKVNELHKKSNKCDKINDQIISILKTIVESKTKILQSAKIDNNNFELIQNNSQLSITIFPHRNLTKKEEISNKLKADIEHNFSEFNTNEIINDNNVFIIVNDNINSKSFKTIHVVREKDILKSLKIIYNLHILKINYLMNSCNIGEDNLDPKDDAILFSPNRNLMNISGEKYFPPVGWFGVGLKTQEENTNWPIAYIAINGSKFYENYGQIIRILEIIIQNKKIDILVSDLENKEKDRRHLNNIIGKGIFLFQRIECAEKCTNIIEFGEKKYKIILMVKVKKDKIKESEKHRGVWFVDKDSIHIYRVLFKEVDDAKINV